MRFLRKLLGFRVTDTLLGYCQGCGCSVRESDEYRYVPAGIAHRECTEYVLRRYRVPPRGWAA